MMPASSPFPLPPFDPQLESIAASMPVAPMTSEALQAMRRQTNAGVAAVQPKLDLYDVTLEEVTIPGPGGDIVLAIIRPDSPTVNAPAIYNIHGGGMIMGDRYTNMSDYHLIEWVVKFDLVLVSVEY